MSRRLAPYRCGRAGHLLAWAEMPAQDEMVVHVNGPWADDDRQFRRNRRDVTTIDVPADSVGGWSGAYASCSCRVDHWIDLGALVGRARGGDTRVVRVEQVQRRL